MSREIDRLVAEKVMGWHIERIIAHDGITGDYDNWCDASNRGMVLPSRWAPSTNFADAWKVVEKMKGDGYLVHVEDFDNRYRVNFCGPERPPVWNWRRNVEHCDAPLAICLAALRAVGIEPPTP